MFTDPPRHYNRCFISAPFGIDLGVLPILLAGRQIGWNWSADAPIGGRYSAGIERCDFMIAVLNGSRNDQRVLYEAGLAEGLGKPVLFIATSKRVAPFPKSMFSPVEAKLTEREPLALHLAAFLATPHETIFERERSKAVRPKVALPPAEKTAPKIASVLERRVYEAVIAAGGSAVSEPQNESAKQRPDLLIWLAAEDPELLDPAVVEVKVKAQGDQLRRAQHQLLDFINASGVKSGFLLTQEAPSEKRIAIAPNLFWLSIDHFVELLTDHRLGPYIRRLRNQAAHGGN